MPLVGEILLIPKIIDRRYFFVKSINDLSVVAGQYTYYRTIEMLQIIHDNGGLQFLPVQYSIRAVILAELMTSGYVIFTMSQKITSQDYIRF